MQEMQQNQLKPSFGQLIEISREDYIREVTEAPKGLKFINFFFLNFFRCSSSFTFILKLY